MALGMKSVKSKACVFGCLKLSLLLRVIFKHSSISQAALLVAELKSNK
jgi:hypothetical protein